MNAFVLAEEELFLACEVTEDAVSLDFIDGEGVEAGGVGGGEFGVDCFSHAGDLDADHVRLSGRHALETPEGGCHLRDETFFDGVLRFPHLEVVVDQALVVNEVLAGEDEGVGVGGVGYGVKAGGLFAGFGFGAGGFLRILAGCEFAFVELFHNSRIAGGCKGFWIKLFGISVEWVVNGKILGPLMGADQRG